MIRRLPLLLDAAVPVLVGAVVAVGVVVRGNAHDRPLSLALALTATTVLAARREAPGLTLAGSGAAVLVLFALDHAAGAAAAIAPAVALYSVALNRGRRQQVVAALAAVAAVITADVFLGGGHAFRIETIAHVALVAVPLLAAEALRNRRSYIELLLERLELAERTREEEARRRVEQERLRIARDLHDVVAHTLTTINVQAGVAAHLLDREAEHAHGALRTIEDASREALGELRALVGVLRERENEEAPLEPAPTLDTVGELVERTRAYGLEVELEIAGERPERVSEAVQQAAFRIVQESLTNVRRHAPGAAATVRLAFGADRLSIAVENPVNSPVSADGVLGVGITGMKERAAALGGTLEAGPYPSGFCVTAELPYRGRE